MNEHYNFILNKDFEDEPLNRENPNENKLNDDSIQSFGEVNINFDYLQRPKDKPKNSKDKLSDDLKTKDIKTNFSTKKTKHTKFSHDNMRSRLKSHLIEAIRRHLNVLYKIKSKAHPGFRKLNKDIKKVSKIKTNLNLLNSKLKDIFSYDISKEKYGLDYNRKLIIKIYEENTNKRLISALERTFLECLEQFRGTKKYEELEGLEKNYNDLIKKFESKESSDYIGSFQNFVKNYENYLNKKRKNNK